MANAFSGHPDLCAALWHLTMRDVCRKWKSLAIWRETLTLQQCFNMFPERTKREMTTKNTTSVTFALPVCICMCVLFIRKLCCFFLLYLLLPRTILKVLCVCSICFSGSLYYLSLQLPYCFLHCWAAAWFWWPFFIQSLRQVTSV